MWGSNISKIPRLSGLLPFLPSRRSWNPAESLACLVPCHRPCWQLPSRSHFKEAFGFQNYNALGLPCQSNGWPLALPLRGAPVPSLVKELRSYMLYHAAKKKLQYLHPRTYTICKNTFPQSLFTHLLFCLPFSPLHIIVCHTHKTEKRRKRRCTPLYPDSQRLFLSDLHLATLSRMSLYLLQLSYKQIHLFLSGIFFSLQK